MVVKLAPSEEALPRTVLGEEIPLRLCEASSAEAIHRKWVGVDS